MASYAELKLPSDAMTMPLDQLESEMLSRPAAERSRLLERLIASLGEDAEIRRAWQVEAERRDAEISRAGGTASDGPQAVEKLRARLR